jgi:hypothetical protein
VSLKPAGLALVLWLAGGLATAGAAPADAQAEIGHLLDFIGASSCTFIRNGEPHPAADARAHIERKYRHAAKWVGTAEDFIAYAATKSSVTGVPYRVRCGESEVASTVWLQEELSRFRARKLSRLP